MLAWAHDHDGLIVEYDYVGEFRYDIAALPVLASLDPNRVVYLGTVSKVLSPALRVGCVVAPPVLRVRLIDLKTIADDHTAWPVQGGLASFLRSGHLERHLRRMRRIYAHKRRVPVRELAAARIVARIGGLEAGFHVHLSLDPSRDPVEVARQARERRGHVEVLAPFHASDTAPPGLLLGYGGLETTDFGRGTRGPVEILNRLAATASR